MPHHQRKLSNSIARHGLAVCAGVNALSDFRQGSNQGASEMTNRTFMRGLRHVPSVAVAMFLSGTVYAADLGLYRTAPLVAPPSAAFDWTGFHIGLIAGYAWDGHDVDYSYNNVPSFILPMLPTHADLTSQGASVGVSSATTYGWVFWFLVPRAISHG